MFTGRSKLGGGIPFETAAVTSGMFAILGSGWVKELVVEYETLGRSI